MLCLRALYVMFITFHPHTHTTNQYSADSTPTPVARMLRLGGGGEQTFRRRRQIVNDVTVGTYNPIINDIADLKPVIKSPSRRRGGLVGGWGSVGWQTGGAVVY